MSSLRIGYAEVDFTPPAGLPLMGNFREDYAATGTHDPLKSKAIVFSNRLERRIALISLDLCMLNRHQVHFMREFIHGECDIPKENILICATHTHGGPATISECGAPVCSKGQIEEFLKKASSAVMLALNNIVHAEIRIGYGLENCLSFNRRLLDKQGNTRMNWEENLAVSDIEGPLGLTDPQITTLAVCHQGTPKAILVNFSLHPAILDYENTLYTADYPGYLSEAIQKIFASDVMTLFVNGCCGNINHINYADPSAPRRGYTMAQRVGYMLAADSVDSFKKSISLQGEPFGISRDHVALTRYKIPIEKYEFAKRLLEPHNNADPSVVRKADGLPVEYEAMVWKEMYERQEQKDLVETMVMRIGDLAIVGLPGEVFCELGLEIRKSSPAPHTIVISLANDAIGYLPNRSAFKQGGYETTPGATFYEPGAGEMLVESALRQIRRLYS